MDEEDELDEFEAYRRGYWEAKRSAPPLGKRKLLLLLVEHKFGPAPKPLKRRIANASDARIERWATRLLAAEDLGEVFARKRPARSKLEQRREFLALVMPADVGYGIPSAFTEGHPQSGRPCSVPFSAHRVLLR